LNHALLSLFSVETLSEQASADEILQLNQKTEQYGLSLTPAQARELVQARSEQLTASGRVEVGSATIGKLIEAFYDSSFISQQDYMTVMHEMIEIFYYAKNETLNLISDDELIEFMKDSFENRCMGSLDFLKGRELEKLADNLRRGVEKYRNMEYEPEEEGFGIYYFYNSPQNAYDYLSDDIYNNHNSWREAGEEFEDEP
jgi:hypothetical protein